MALFSKLYLYKSEGDSRGKCRAVGALLRLYLDGCLFSCKCSRLFFAYLELEFRSQFIISTLY